MITSISFWLQQQLMFQLKHTVRVTFPSPTDGWAPSNHETTWVRHFKLFVSWILGTQVVDNWVPASPPNLYHPVEKASSHNNESLPLLYFIFRSWLSAMYNCRILVDLQMFNIKRINWDIQETQLGSISLCYSLSVYRPELQYCWKYCNTHCSITWNFFFQLPKILYPSEI